MRSGIYIKKELNWDTTISFVKDTIGPLDSDWNMQIFRFVVFRFIETYIQYRTPNPSPHHCHISMSPSPHSPHPMKNHSTHILNRKVHTFARFHGDSKRYALSMCPITSITCGMLRLPIATHLTIPLFWCFVVATLILLFSRHAINSNLGYPSYDSSNYCLRISIPWRGEHLYINTLPITTQVMHACA